MKIDEEKEYGVGLRICYINMLMNIKFYTAGTTQIILSITNFSILTLRPPLAEHYHFGLEYHLRCFLRSSSLCLTWCLTFVDIVVVVGRLYALYSQTQF